MTTDLRVLIASDEPARAELLTRTLTDAGYHVAAQRVDALEQIHDFIGDGAPSLVLCDAGAAGLTPRAVLALLARHSLRTPLIVLCEPEREAEALAAMDAGASDVIAWSGLARLGRAVRRELPDALTAIGDGTHDSLLQELFNLTTALNAAGTEEQVLHVIADRLAVICQAELTSGGQVHPDGTYQFWARHPTGWEMIRYELDQHTSIVGHVLATGRPYRSADLASDPLTDKPWDAAHGLHTQLSVPLTDADGNVLGVVSLHNKLSGAPFSDEDESLVSAMAAHAAAALERARSRSQLALVVQSLEESQEERRFFADMRATLVDSLDFETTAASVAQVAVPALADLCLVEILGEDGSLQQLALAAADPEVESAARELYRRFPTDVNGPDAVATALRTGEPVIEGKVTEVDRAWHARSAEHAQMLQALPVTSLMAVPLVARGHRHGVLALMLTGTGGRYRSNDLQTVEELARRAALAIDNARLYAAEQQARRAAERAVERTARLQELTAALGDTRTPQDVATIISEQARAAVGAEGCILTRLTRDGRALRLLAADGYAPDLFDWWRRAPWEMPEILARAVRAGQLLLLHRDDETVENATTVQRLLDRLGHEAIAIIPLITDGNAVGVLAFSYADPPRFSLNEVTFLLTLARQCAQAFERSRLHLAEQQAARRNLAQKTELEAILTHLSDGLMLADQYGQVTMLNPAARALLRVDPDDGIWPRQEAEFWQPILPLGTPVQPEALPLARALAGEHGPARELEVVTGEEARMIAASAAPIRTPEGSLQGAVALLRDVTETRRAEERIAESERLRSLGEMASGVAHDFNNLIAVILGRCELLLALAASGSQVVDGTSHLEVVKQAALDGAETVKRLQAFSGVSRGSPAESMDLAAVVRDVVEYARPRWRDGARLRGVSIQVKTEVEALPPVEGSPSELREVLLNLIFNAVDAMPHGGTIHIAAEQRGDNLLIRVQDTGVGMTDAVRRRIFDPFFSTKGTRGTGLGLSMSYGIVSRMGGHIDVESSPNAGSTFTVTLPFRAAADQQRRASTGRPRLLSLLVVDDEPSVLSTTALILEQAGHTVTTAGSGEEALSRLRSDLADDGLLYDAILTDLGMPGMNGLQLVAAIRAAGIPTPCVLVTGWGLELADDDVRAAGVQAVLPKPFSAADLRDMLDAVVVDEDDDLADLA